MVNVSESPSRTRPWRRWARASGLAIGVLLLAGLVFGSGALTGFLELRHAVRAMNADVGRIASPNGVQEAHYIELNGIRQWITITGQDRAAPLLVFLHGGPGGALADMSYTFQRPWEDYFTVVQWDQRGYGRSAIDTPKLRGSTTKEQYIADAIGLIDYLRDRFHQPKVVLLGQSWGTLLGLEIAHRRPDLLYAYVGIGQLTAWEQNFEGSRQNLLALAARTHDTALTAAMRRAGKVPVGPALGKAFVHFDDVVGGAVVARGYSWHNFQGPGDSWDDRLETAYMVSPSVSDADLLHRFLDRTDTFSNYFTLHPTITGWDAEHDVGTRFEVPVIIFAGHYDWQTPIDRARAYFEQICAPWKVWVEFPYSAHVVTLEEPGRTVVSLVEDVLPATRGQMPPVAQRCGRGPGQVGGSG